MDFLDVLVHSDDLEIWLEEIVIRPDTTLDGTLIGTAVLRENASVTVLAARRADGRMLVNPGADEVLQAGDMLIVLGRRSDLDRIEHAH